MTARLRLLGAAGAALFLAPVAAGVYRVYGPGDFGRRVQTLKSRWEPFVNPEIAGLIWKFIGRGLLLTLQAAVVSVLLSIVFGLLLALLRLSRHKLLGLPIGKAARALAAFPASVVVQGVRSAPLFLIILYTYLAAPRLGVNLSPMAAGITALTAYTSCVMAEIIRAGILSLERGQLEAAAVLGLGYRKSLRLVVLPQALRRMAPAAVSQLVTLIKDTSLLSYITVLEVSRRLNILQQQYVNPIECFLVAGLIYFALNFSLSALGRRLEAAPGRGSPEVALRLQQVGAEDQTRPAA
ncbi:MAG TPA: amino acid ABC transporter permease [Actinomycetota bacterium]|nr:amino acid ABC transporter permease [Actinomycetota bacterium]